MLKLVFVVIAARLILTACPPPNRDINPAGLKVPLITSDLVQALPGRPLDRCTIKAHIQTERSFPCLSTEELNNMIRNRAAEAGGNCVILTTYIEEAGECAHAARGIVLSCPEEALKAAAL